MSKPYQDFEQALAQAEIIADKTNTTQAVIKKSNQYSVVQKTRANLNDIVEEVDPVGS